MAARVPTGWELAALAWLALIAVPLAFTGVAARRLPDRMTCQRLHRKAHPAGRRRDHGARAGPPRPRAIGAAARACFYLVLALISQSGMGMSDAKLAASIGFVLGWTSWQALLFGAF